MIVFERTHAKGRRRPDVVLDGVILKPLIERETGGMDRRQNNKLMGERAVRSTIINGIRKKANINVDSERR